MKEILTVTANFHAVWAEGSKKLLPQAEVTLVMSEPSYTVDGVGDVIRQRTTSHVRFSANPKILRKLAESFMKLADEAEELPLENKNYPDANSA